jgi:rhodanese-related sulfurtransferase
VRAACARLLAARNLKEMGYTHVTSLIGGFNGWKNAGLRFQDADAC